VVGALFGFGIDPDNPVVVHIVRAVDTIDTMALDEPDNCNTDPLIDALTENPIRVNPILAT
jgi:hypothetical protein